VATSDYQVRNFYNSSVSLSKLDFSKDVLNESRYPKIHLISPGCNSTCIIMPRSLQRAFWNMKKQNNDILKQEI